MSASRVVNVINLGRMGFLQAYDVQLRYAKQHLDFLAGRLHTPPANTLLLVEHTPVYTVGLRTKDYDEMEEVRLKKLGAEFYRTNRGGLITFHGPGQLVAYPVLNLKGFEPSMKKYIASLESTVINTCQRLDIPAHTTSDTGVWVGDRKIAAVGVHGSRYITTHGVSLNCDTDLTWFRHIVPCGILGKDVTSVTRELGKPTSIQSVLGHFLSAMEEEFDCQLTFNMFDSQDTDWLRGQQEDEEEEVGVGEEMLGAVSSSSSSSTAHPAKQASAQQGMRLMSTSSSRQPTLRGIVPKITMW